MDTNTSTHDPYYINVAHFDPVDPQQDSGPDLGVIAGAIVVVILIIVIVIVAVLIVFFFVR